jgi:hypothetical protein
LGLAKAGDMTAAHAALGAECRDAGLDIRRVGVMTMVRVCLHSCLKSSEVKQEGRQDSKISTAFIDVLLVFQD